MAKSRNRSGLGRSVFSSRPRAAFPLAQSARPRFSSHSAKSLISTVPDDTVRRQVRPLFNRFSPVAVARATSRVKVPSGIKFPILKEVFPLAQRAFDCARRQIRKEVLFATHQNGAGSRSRHRQRSNSSRSKCK